MKELEEAFEEIELAQRDQENSFGFPEDFDVTPITVQAPLPQGGRKRLRGEQSVGQREPASMRSCVVAQAHRGGWAHPSDHFADESGVISENNDARVPIAGISSCGRSCAVGARAALMSSVAPELEGCVRAAARLLHGNISTDFLVSFMTMRGHTRPTRH